MERGRRGKVGSRDEMRNGKNGGKGVGGRKCWDLNFYFLFFVIFCYYLYIFIYFNIFLSKLLYSRAI